MACRQALPWSRCTASHGLGLRLMTSRLACSSCAIERCVQMARVVREDWPHVDMDMGKRQVGEGKWAGEEGPRAHTLQGLIRRASRLSPVSAVSAVYYNVVLLFRVLVSCGSSRRPCEVTSVLGLPGARDTVTDARQRHAWNAWSGTASSSLILMTAESRQLLQFRTPAHDRHVGAL